MIGLEHAELRPMIVDLDPARPDEEADALLDELLRPGDDAQVALRGAGGSPRGSDRRTPPRCRPRRAAGGHFDAGRDGNHRLLASRPGSLDSLTPTWWQRTPPGPGEVEIEVAAAGLNFSDVLKALGIYPGCRRARPARRRVRGPHHAPSARASTGLAVGDRVMAVARHSIGRSSPRRRRAPLVAPRPPAASSFEEAAAMPIAFLTAVLRAGTPGPAAAEGETVLIHSATGGVGLAALQLARRRGAEVFATAGTRREAGATARARRRARDGLALARLRRRGRRTSPAAAASTSSSTRSPARPLPAAWRCSPPGGRFVEIGKRDIYDNSHVGLAFFKHNRSFLAVDLERSLREQPALIARAARRGRGAASSAATSPRCR